jgi:hypothetical protein
VLALVFLFVFTHQGILGQNDLSRFVAVDSLVNRGVMHIDASSWAQAKIARDGRRYHMLNDMVYNRRDGHLYSSKPPVLTLILAGVLEGFEVLGAEFSFTGRAADRPTFLLTWLVIGSMSALAFYAFRRRVARTLGGTEGDAATLLALGGTLFLSYSVTMNHHTFTATLILLSFFLLGMAGGEEEPPPSRFCLAGLLMGLAAVVDVGHGFIFSVAFASYIAFHRRSWRSLLLFGAGGMAPLALHSAVQYSVWGSILPVQMIEGTKDYAASYWDSPIGPDTWDIPRYRYWLLTLFSTRGLFVLSPVLLLGAAELARDVGRGLRGEDVEAGYAALSVGFGIAFLLAYYGFVAPTNFGGSCFGMRWYIGFMPLLGFYAARFYAAHRGSPRHRGLFYALGLISVAYALIGMQEPWALMENNAHPAVQMLMVLRGF